jgi:hypothetical protein
MLLRKLCTVLCRCTCCSMARRSTRKGLPRRRVNAAQFLTKPWSSVCQHTRYRSVPCVRYHIRFVCLFGRYDYSPKGIWNELEDQGSIPDRDRVSLWPHGVHPASYFKDVRCLVTGTKKLGLRPDHFSSTCSQINKGYNCTRWFKYDRDDLCVNKSQFVPVMFEPPCISLIFMS